LKGIGQLIEIVVQALSKFLCFTAKLLRNDVTGILDE